jgi:hypothetical protein
VRAAGRSVSSRPRACSAAITRCASRSSGWHGRSLTDDYPVEGGHFAERFQSFIIIALGESIVVTGATPTSKGLGTTVVFALALAFLDTGALPALAVSGLVAGLLTALAIWEYPAVAPSAGRAN